MLPRLAAIAGSLLLATPGARAEPAGPQLDPEVLAVAEARLDGGRTHLWRNLIWGGASILGGGALALGSDRGEHPTRWAFGVQNAIWGGIDLGIGVAGLLILRGPPDDTDLAEVIDKERLFHDALLLNMGLDVGYIGLGATLVFAAGSGIDNADELKGHGAAIMIQGGALLTFEILAWLGSRRRLDALVEMRLSPVPVYGGAGLGLGGRF